MGATGALGANPPGTESLNKRRYLTATNTPRSTVHNHQLIPPPLPTQTLQDADPRFQNPNPLFPTKTPTTTVLHNAKSKSKSKSAGRVVGWWVGNSTEMTPHEEADMQDQGWSMGGRGSGREA